MILLVLCPSCAYVSGPIGGFKRAAFYVGTSLESHERESCRL